MNLINANYGNEPGLKSYTESTAYLRDHQNPGGQCAVEKKVSCDPPSKNGALEWLEATPA